MAGISQHDCPQPSNSLLVSVKCTRGRRENIFWESSSDLALVLWTNSFSVPKTWSKVLFQTQLTGRQAQKEAPSQWSWRSLFRGPPADYPHPALTGSRKASATYINASLRVSTFEQDLSVITLSSFKVKQTVYNPGYKYDKHGRQYPLVPFSKPPQCKGPTFQDLKSSSMPGQLTELGGSPNQWLNLTEKAAWFYDHVYTRVCSCVHRYALQ